MSISQFMDHHFRHFNARETVDASRAWKKHLDDGGKMFLAMAGAMSTAELGISLAKMIRAGKIHAISCTAANFEEDIFNLVATKITAWCPTTATCRPTMKSSCATRVSIASPTPAFQKPSSGTSKASCSNTGSRPAKRASRTSPTSTSIA